MKEIKREVILNLSKEKIWDLLFNDTYVYQYMGCHLRLRDGLTMEWYMIKDDLEIVLLTGEIIEKKNEEYLLIKTYNPHRNYDKEYYLFVEYKIETNKLIIKQTGFEALPAGDQVYLENQMGWNMVIENLKGMF